MLCERLKVFQLGILWVNLITFLNGRHRFGKVLVQLVNFCFPPVDLDEVWLHLYNHITIFENRFQMT